MSTFRASGAWCACCECPANISECGEEALAGVVRDDDAEGMKLIKRKSSARWFYKADGKTEILISDRTLLKHAVSSGRLPLTDRAATGAAELVAAAHALCFSLALTTQLGNSQRAGGRVQTTATVTLENWVSGWTVTNIHLNVRARLPEMTQCDFIDATMRAKTSCFVSRLMKANISMNAKLDR